MARLCRVPRATLRDGSVGQAKCAWRVSGQILGAERPPCPDLRTKFRLASRSRTSYEKFVTFVVLGHPNRGRDLGGGTSKHGGGHASLIYDRNRTRDALSVEEGVAMRWNWAKRAVVGALALSLVAGLAGVSNACNRGGGGGSSAARMSGGMNSSMMGSGSMGGMSSMSPQQLAYNLAMLQQQQQMAAAAQQQYLAAKAAEQAKKDEKKQKRIQAVQAQRAELAAEKERLRQRNLEKLAERN